MIRVEDKGLVIGLLTIHGKVSDAPPTARWSLGRSIGPVMAFYRRRGAKIMVLRGGGFHE